MLTSIVDARQVSVLRNGQEVSVYIPEDMMERLLADSVRFASFRYPFVIDSIMPGQPAALAGLQPGDSITQLDGRNIAYFDFKEEMLNRQKAANDSTSRLLTLTYVRAGVADTVKLTTDSLYQIGVAASCRQTSCCPLSRKNIVSSHLSRPGLPWE